MKNTIAALLLIFYLNTKAQHFKQHVLFLASDSLHGRAPGTVDELKAANYIATQFDSANCKVVFQKFRPILNPSPPHPPSTSSLKEKGSIASGQTAPDSAINVFGILDFGKDSTIIISAHYDHLGYGTNKSREIIRKGIHHGADDNASGVAMMIELAKWIDLVSNPPPPHRPLTPSPMEKGSGIIFLARDFKYNFLFAAYSAHEAGLFGSAYFAKSKLCNSLKIRAVINFDMVGRLDSTSKTLRISGAETDPVFHTLFHQQQDSVFHFRFDDENILLSDLNPFAEKGIPVLNITTGIHDDYHRISDVESKINYEGMNSIFRLIKKILSGYLNK